MKSNSYITVWFGKEIDISEVKAIVKSLQQEGYKVRSPFYIGYNIRDSFVLDYLKQSLDASDYLYLIGTQGKLLEEITEYAKLTKKHIVRKDIVNLCC